MAHRRVYRRIPCPHCGDREGFLLELGGVSYRVLEDENDTELLHEAAPDASVTCIQCKTDYTRDEALEIAEAARERRAERLRILQDHHLHKVGKAKTRTTKDGRTLPVCPSCGATHHFFVDIDGVAYKVLEDDEDTELLADADNFLCARCNAVFDL